MDSGHREDRPQRSWLQGRSAYEVGYAGLVIGASALALLPVLRRSGWPFNQGSTAPFLLVQMYAAHIRHHDFLPVWSSSDGIGMGSPVLLYYHRTFYFLAGLIYALFGGLKNSVVATIGIFLAIGAYGLRRALGVVTNSRLLRTFGSVGFLFTNYVFTDWLDPRGDLGEFAAVMLVPWLLWWCLNLVKHRVFSLGLIPIMVLLVYAHSGIALVSVATLVVALATFIMFNGIRGLRAVAWRVLIAVGGTTLLLFPTLLAEFKLGRSFDPQTKNTIVYKASQQFVSFGSYFYDSMHHWLGPTTTTYFVQIDFAIWGSVAVAVIGIGVYWIPKRRRPRRWSLPHSSDSPVVLMLAVSIAIYLFLQLSISGFVYRLLPPLQVINFPWRMLALITPIGIIIVVVVADALMRRFPITLLWRAMAGAWFASLIALSPVTSPFTINYRSFAPPGHFPAMSFYQAPKYVDYQTFDGFFIGPYMVNDRLVAFPGYFVNPYGVNDPRRYLIPPGSLYNVFLPKVIGVNGLEETNVEVLLEELHRHDAGAQSLSQVQCSVNGPAHAAFETLQLTFSVACDGATRLALPISYNKYSKVFVRDARGKLQQIHYSHIRSDPRMIIHVSSGIPETVVVHLPTLWGILS